MQHDANPGFFSVSSFCKNLDDERVIHPTSNCGAAGKCGVHEGLEI